MISVGLRSLLDHLGRQAVIYLNNAAGLCVSMGHREVTIEHFFLKALEDPASEFSLLIRQGGGETARILAALTADVEAMSGGAPGKPVFSPLLLDMFQDAWLVASLELGIASITSGAAMLAVLVKPGRYMAGGAEKILNGFSREAALKDYSVVRPNASEFEAAAAASPMAAEGVARASEGGFIARYCEDFTAKAKAGKLDPVFGRDAEIRSMMDIFARRRKNNPILVGDPGVGKTALVEGLAGKIAAGEVPDTLLGVRLICLDMGALEAGAGMKGEFENRLKGVLDEIKSSPTPIVLFIDEAHTLIGAGGSAGTSDAANLLKPALARGELRTCAATTWKEYKKYFEKDAALTRRFQLVALDEPSVEDTRQILRGVKPAYEKSHGIIISDAAIECAADYADRYISGRFQPDKSVDLLDTACARVKVALAARPGVLEDAEERAAGLLRRIDSLKRDRDNLLPIDEEQLAALEAEREAAIEESKALEARWKAEQDAVRTLIAAREALHVALDASAPVEAPEAPGTSGASAAPTASEASQSPSDANAAAEENAPPPPPDADAARAALHEASETLVKLQKVGPLLFSEVGPEAVASVVADWTGIPLGRLGEDQAAMVADLKDILARRVRGQDEALSAMARNIQVAKAGLKDPDRPMGVFLLTGPSGTGKTETGLALAELLFGSEKNIVSVNMGEFQEKHTVSRLIGSPPGYVGYGEGGMLTEAVRRQPYCVVLLDEVEKAHPDIMNLFYQVFDKGILQDGEGKEVRFRNTVIVLTSNIGSDIIEDSQREKPGEVDTDTLLAALRPVLNAQFKPALVGRMTVLPYMTLSDAAMRDIIEQKLKRIAAQLKANSKITLEWTSALPENIAQRCTEVETGARNIEYILNLHILPRLSKCLLSGMAEAADREEAGLPPLSVARLDIGPEGECAVELT
ncbi:MAG: type VI secretion system ATPase TssH [Candidatus Accumulibacter sp.]|jgi:type VI secretion system protein VasG|nr:type VI secretion system ATPase TssH [Accumulibacter sp.]